jgi:hypothetical protein
VSGVFEIVSRAYMRGVRLWGERAQPTNHVIEAVVRRGSGEPVTDHGECRCQYYVYV